MPGVEYLGQNYPAQYYEVISGVAPPVFGTLNIMTIPVEYDQGHRRLNPGPQTSGVGASQTITITGVPGQRITLRSIFIYASAAGGATVTIQDGASVVIDLGTIALTTAASGVNVFLFTGSPGNNIVINIGAIAGATTTASAIADADG